MDLEAIDACLEKIDQRGSELCEELDNLKQVLSEDEETPYQEGRSDSLEAFKAELARRVPSLWLEDAMSPKDLAERIAKELGETREAGAKEN